MTERILSQTQSVEMGILQRVQAWHFAAKCAVVKFVKPWMSNHFSLIRAGLSNWFQVRGQISGPVSSWLAWKNPLAVRLFYAARLLL